MTLQSEPKTAFFATILVLSLFAWSVIPKYIHVPNVMKTLHEHLEMVAEHGHSHGFAEDMIWAMHGHDHDEIDHDHSPVVLIANQHAVFFPIDSEWQQLPTSDIGSPSFLIERPPRV